MAPHTTATSESATTETSSSSSSAFKLPSTPGMALFPLSPERVQNISRVPVSPSLPNISEGKSIFTPIAGEGDVSSPASPLSARHQMYMSDGKPYVRTTSSEVQSMVARFNSLDIKDHAELRKKDAAALKRAQMGREEAEYALQRMREENRRMKEEINECRDRELRVSKRLENVMEDLHRAKETHDQTENVYEKEIRRARKEAFKSSSALVKLQEELKTSRAAMKVAKADLDMEKMKSGRRDQEAFSAQYELIGVREQLEQTQARVKVVEEERDALKTNLKEEEVARIAAEGRIALPLGRDEDDEFASPKKSRPRGDVDHVDKARTAMELNDLRSEVERERHARQKAEQQIDFMKMECQFGCCSCRVADIRGVSFVHDIGYGEDLKRARSITPEALVVHMDLDQPAIADEPLPAYSETPVGTPAPASREQTPPLQTSLPIPSHKASTRPSLLPAFGDEPLLMSSRTSEATPISSLRPEQHTSPIAGALQAKPASPVPGPSELSAAGTSEIHAITSQDREDIPNLLGSPAARNEPYSASLGDDMDQEPETPAHVSYRTITTTTTVPIRSPTRESSRVQPSLNGPSTPSAATAHVNPKTPVTGLQFDPSWAVTPGMMNLTREEAMEQIRQRRGRARSIAGTPAKRAASQGASKTPRRDISAPVSKTPKTAGRGRLP